MLLYNIRLDKNCQFYQLTAFCGFYFDFTTEICRNIDKNTSLAHGYFYEIGINGG